MNFIVLPHQLFEKKYLPKNISKVYLWEHKQYFTKYKYNKKKLILHRASMKLYNDYLKKQGFKTQYIEYTDLIDSKKSYIMFDPIDKLNFKKYKISYLESPNFLLTKYIYNEYRQKTDKFLFNNFYIFGKKKINVIPTIKSQDKDNRKKIPKSLKLPKLSHQHTKTEKEYINEAKKYVSKHFSKNPGSIENFIYPISHSTSKKWLKLWIKTKFKLFGSYQDSIHNEQSFLFHSVLSSSINIGLINPTYILGIIKKDKKKIPLNSYEGYIRQLFWREYQRYCYIYYDFKPKKYFSNNNKLTKKWYYGKTGIKPVDDCIIKGFENGYLNHIERLMVVGNFMVLSGLKPLEGFKWFMEMSCDSYDWVMEQNVLDMVFFVSGGVTMRRPYMSSSNYVLKMSNYKKDEWCEKWDKMYKKFKRKNKSKLWKFRYFFGGLKDV